MQIVHIGGVKGVGKSTVLSAFVQKYHDEFSFKIVESGDSL